MTRGLIQSLGFSPFLFVAAVCSFGLVPAEDVWGQKTKAKKAAIAEPPATPATSHEVAKGDTLFRIAGKIRTQGVTLNQMVLGLYRANPDAFLNGQINQLLVGKVLKIPPRETLISIDPAQASQQVKALLAKPSPPPAPIAPQPAEPQPMTPPPVAPSKPRAAPKALSPDQAEVQLKQGIEHERNGDLRSALKAYQASGEAGNGEAQKRLGDMYNKGNEVVQRDYETALKWYQKARAQGVEIPKPITNPGPRH